MKFLMIINLYSGECSAFARLMYLFTYLPTYPLTYLLTYLLNYLHTYLLHEAKSFLRNKPLFSQSRNSPHFMEPEGSLPHLGPPPVPIPSQLDPVHNPTAFITHQ